MAVENEKSMAIANEKRSAIGARSWLRPSLWVGLSVLAFGVFLLNAYLQRIEEESLGGPSVAVLMARETLSLAAPLKPEMLAERMVPEAYVDTRAVRASDRARILGMKVRVPLQAQQQLMWSDLALAGDEHRDVSALVQPGMRAFTLHAEGRPSSLVRPGDRVDVLGTFANSGTDVRNGVVLLQNVLVLARPGEAASRSGQDGSELSLSLTLVQAQLLAVAADKGKLTVALRNPDDVRVEESIPEVSSASIGEAEKRVVLAKGKGTPLRLDSAALR